MPDEERLEYVGSMGESNDVDTNAFPMRPDERDVPPTRMRRFVFNRIKDVSGLSGTGVVVEGVEFSGGWVALTWLSPLSSVSFYPNVKTAIEIHGHEGQTVLQWLD